MPPGEADNDPLFAALALELGLVDREALAAATRALRACPGPLARLLVERGDLSAADRARVEQIVAGLAGPVGTVLPDADATVSLSGTLPTATAAADFAAGEPGTLLERTGVVEPTLPATLAGPSGGDRPAAGPAGDRPRFRVLRHLAKGGIGEVAVALDAELNREVALKRIQPARDDTHSRARFLVEAEVTGRLEHPGVVPVYALGTDPEGRPYYAMRLIKGESLKEAIDRFHDAATPPPAADPRAAPRRPFAALEFRQLLGRFVAACNAMAYAHSRGVIHRDIKPANIMLGPYGETLIVDWGLAKPVGGAATGDGGEARLEPSDGTLTGETCAGSVVGTPGYLSPEQAEGDVDRLGPATDIFALGATLYVLLTGRSPLGEAKTILEAIEAARQGRFPSPRSVVAEVPRPLEAIVLKAMARRPEDRYPSATALAEDVERWLADEPVSAWPEPWWTRSLRWARHHKQAVVGAGALLVATVIGLTIGTLLLERANARTQRERDLARKNFALARRAVDDYLTKVGQDRLLNEPGLQDLRRELLESALPYFREFLAQHGDDPSLTTETALAFERVGDIQSDLGRPADAENAYAQALELTEKLVAEDSRQAGLREARVRLAWRQGNQMRLGRKGAEGIARIRQAADEGEKHLIESPEPAMQALVAKILLNLSVALDGAGATERALAATLRAIELAGKARAARPDDLDIEADLIEAHGVAGNQQQHAGRPDEALRNGTRAVELARAQFGRRPRDVDAQIRLGRGCSQLAYIYKARGDSADALKWLEEADRLLGEVVGSNPLLVRARFHWAYALNNLAQVRADLRQFDAARAAARQAVALGRQLRERLPESASVRSILAIALASLGKAEAGLDQAGPALAAFDEATGLLRQGDSENDAFNLACALAAASRVDPGRAAALRDEAIAALQVAFDRGYRDAEAMRNDPDLAPIRDRAEFRDLLGRMVDQGEKAP